MKYPCDLIRDIMPLYHDEVASEESRKAVEEHFEECSVCRGYYDLMCESDAVENAAFDVEVEKKTADSYKNVYKKIVKKICKMLGIVALAIIGVILLLYILVVAYVKISAAASWEEHRDISQYAMLDNGENVLDVFAAHGYSSVGGEYIDRIWPWEITESMNVLDYLLIYYNPWDSNYLGYLVVEYTPEAYEAEVAFLSAYPSDDYLGRYGAEGFSKYELLAMKYTSYEFIYALTDGEDTIIYVGIQFPGYGTDIEYEKYIPEEYLPEGLDISKDNPTRQKILERYE